jgi:hypothetical protein
MLLIFVVASCLADLIINSNLCDLQDEKDDLKKTEKALQNQITVINSKSLVFSLKYFSGLNTNSSNI